MVNEFILYRRFHTSLRVAMAATTSATPGIGNTMPSLIAGVYKLGLIETMQKQAAEFLDWTPCALKPIVTIVSCFAYNGYSVVAAPSQKLWPLLPVRDSSWPLKLAMPAAGIEQIHATICSLQPCDSSLHKKQKKLSKKKTKTRP